MHHELVRSFRFDIVVRQFYKILSQAIEFKMFVFIRFHVVRNYVELITSYSSCAVSCVIFALMPKGIYDCLIYLSILIIRSVQFIVFKTLLYLLLNMD